jgi:hypothetical protein
MLLFCPPILSLHVCKGFCAGCDAQRRDRRLFYFALLWQYFTTIAPLIASASCEPFLYVFLPFINFYLLSTNLLRIAV